MSDAEKYYHSLLTFGMRPGLERIKLLLERLGNPEKALKCIHVAGTNGKGTTCSFIAEILKSAGYKTGLYTSPYIVDFRERIRVNGEMINETELDNVTKKVKSEIIRLNSENVIITEFEAVTAAAFLYFKSLQCDFVVLETGLGGRFDATNVIEKPIASVITSISLDHVKILGDTIEAIAYEKCGIIKKGCPVVTIFSQKTEAMRIIKEQCRIKKSELFVAGDSSFHILSDSISGSNVIFAGREVFVPFPGTHQAENAVLAIQCISIMKMLGISVSEKAIIEGIKNTKNPARCEIVSQNPMIILDGCHNEGSAEALSEVLTKYVDSKKITAVMGMMSDKAVDRVLSILLPHFDNVIAVTPSNPRALKAEKLASMVDLLGVKVKAIDDPLRGIREGLKNLTEDNVLLVCGSLYLCADVRGSLVFG